MSARREELTRVAARLFAEQGYQGTSLADLADALGLQKASLYHHIDGKEDLLWEVAREGAVAFQAALDAVPADAAATDRIRLALRAHLGVVPTSSTSRRSSCASGATSPVNGGMRSSPSAAATRSGSGRSSATASRRGELRTDLDVGTAALLFLSAANWAYTWLRPGADIDALADRLYAGLLDGMRGYATP